MQYDRETIDFHYHNILNGLSPFVVGGTMYYARHISSSLLFEANANNLFLRQQLRPYLASEYEILKDAVSKGLWGDLQEQEIKSLTNIISKKELLLSQLALPSQLKSVQNEIVALNRSLNEKLAKKHSLLSNSLEQKLLNEKRDYICFLGIYKSSVERLWACYDDFGSEDTNLCNSFVVGYYSAINEVTSDLVRAVAKSTDARYKLKNCTPKEASSISINYLELKQWCDFYNNIYELEDKPDNTIIMDDAKLDGWLTARKAKQQASKSVNNSEGGYIGYFGSTKEDMEALEGTDRNTLLKIAKQDNG